MADEIPRCPYCVFGGEFRPLLPRPGGWFICQKCLHMARPEQPDFRCFCLKCGKLNRAA